MTTRTARQRLVGLVAAVMTVSLACTGAGGPILATPTDEPRPTAPPTPLPTRVDDPQPIVLPRDDGPHDRLTEWWYYTGHLQGEDVDTGEERRLGFEFVVFRAERGSFPTTWASHLAVTDETAGTFHYAQRLAIGGDVDRSPRDGAGDPTGFDLAIGPVDPALGAVDPTDPVADHVAAWAMAGSDGADRLSATLTEEEATEAGVPAGLELDLVLEASKPPALHDSDGWIDFAAAGGSYYYSRTAMTADGFVQVDGRDLRVTGTAWFDHQWGDFISVGGGGWDWFAINLDDGTDVTVSVVRDANGDPSLVYGTLVDAAGATTHLPEDAIELAVTDRWQSPATGADYPAAWTLAIPSEELQIDLRPTVADQELDTRATTGVVYWEGSQVVRATRGGMPLGGEAYVELTGYAMVRES